METQPNEAVASESTVDPTADATEAFEQLADNWNEPEPEEDTTEDGDGPTAEVELDETDVEAEGQDEPAPINAPVSWTGENKAKFAELPPELQEYVATRETERERFVQSKAQEAARSRQTAEREALQVIENVQREAAQHLQQYAAQLAVPEPDPNLIVEDPELYAQQLNAHRYYAAQSQQAQQQAQQAWAMAEQAQNEQLQYLQQQTLETLQTQFPEYLSEEQGTKLRQELGAVAIELGFTPEELAQPDARDILAMKKVATYKSKADRYDALMAKKMEGVRAAKSLPKVSRPGTRMSGTQVSQTRANAAWEATKNSKGAARNENFAAYLQSTGQI